MIKSTSTIRKQQDKYEANRQKGKGVKWGQDKENKKSKFRDSVSLDFKSEISEKSNK